MTGKYWVKRLAALLLALLMLLALSLPLSAQAAGETGRWGGGQLVAVERNGGVYTAPKPPVSLAAQAADPSFSRAALTARIEDALSAGKLTVNADGHLFVDISPLGISCPNSITSLNDTAQAISDCFSQFTDPDLHPRYYFIKQFRNPSDSIAYYYRPAVTYALRSGRYQFDAITVQAAFTPFSQAALRAELARYDKGIADALADVPPALTPLEKVLFVHDWIARGCEFDNELSNNYERPREPWICHTAYGVLVNGVAVCQGYAYAAFELLNRLGVETINVVSSALGHEWNMVKLDGKWYHMDITWDDLPAGLPGRLASPPKTPYSNDYWGKADHKNLLLSSNGMRGNGHSSWNVGDGYGNNYPAGTDAAYESYFWKNSESAMVYDENAKLWLYTQALSQETRNKLYAYSFPTKSVAKTISLGFSDSWETGGGSSHVTAPYLILYGSKVYYNTPKALRYIDLADGYADRAGPSIGAPAPTGMQSIYDLRLKGDNAELRLRTRNKNGTGFTYSDYDSVRTVRIWEPHVTYDANGGTGASGMQFKTLGVPLTLSGVIPARSGYTFLGWDASRGAAAPSYPAGRANVYTGDADITLYAIWKGYAYTIQCNANGGAGTMPPVSAVYGTEQALPANAFTRDGFTFKGWATSPGGAAVYADRQNVVSLTETEGAAVELYAVWEPAPPPSNWWEGLPGFLLLLMRIFLLGFLWML